MFNRNFLSAAGGIAAATALLIAGQAAAHASLVKSDPAANATVASPKTITGVSSGPLMAGPYKIAWHAAAADDGHKTTGTLAFTVK